MRAPREPTNTAAPASGPARRDRTPSQSASARRAGSPSGVERSLSPLPRTRNSPRASSIPSRSSPHSSATRNFPNRLGIDTRVYLGSAELAAVCALMGKIPTVAEYMAQVEVVNKKAADIYRYMNFDQIEEFRTVADTVTV